MAYKSQLRCAAAADDKTPIVGCQLGWSRGWRKTRLHGTCCACIWICPNLPLGVARHGLLDDSEFQTYP